MRRFHKYIGAVFGVGGLLTLSVLVSSASADVTVTEEHRPPIQDAGAPITDASSRDVICEDGGCRPSDGARLDAGSIAEGGIVDNEKEVAPPTPRPTRVAVASVSFQNGEVPRAQAALEKLASKELSACASERGGVKGEGTVELKFLVRTRGRAEGVDIGRVRNVPPAVAQCLAWTVARRPVGPPSDEPVFVTAVFKLTEDKSTPKTKPLRAK